MTSAYTSNKAIEQPANGDYNNNWNVPVNANWGIIDKALGGSTSLSATGLSGTQTLTSTQYQAMTLLITGVPSAAITYSVPSGVGGQWIINNATTGSFSGSVYIVSVAGGSTLTLPNGYNVLVSCDGTSGGMRFSQTAPATPAGSNGQVQYNNSGALASSANLTWDNSGNILGVTGSTSVTGTMAAGGNITSTTGNVSASAGNVTAPSGNVSDSKGNVRSIPQNSQTTGYTLVVGDAGKHISITTGGVTVPASIFSIGDAVSIFNNSASSQTITQGTSATMYQAGTANTGNRTLAQRGVCTVLCVASNTFVISGAGIS